MPKIPILSRMVESVRGRTGIVLFPELSTTKRKIPPISFADCAKLHRGDPDVGASLDFIRNVAVGDGFNLSIDPKYPKAEELTEFLVEKCEEFDLDTTSQEITLDLIGYGNHWSWKGSKSKALRMMARIRPSLVQNYTLTDDEMFMKELVLNKVTLPFDEILWLSYNHIAESPLGFGVLQGLLTAYKDRESFAVIKAEIQQSMKEQIKKCSAYNELWTFEGLGSAELKKLNTKIQTMGTQGGRRITTNKKAQILASIPERMRGLDLYAQMLWDSFYLALKTPYPKLVLGGQFTEAAANAAVFLGERNISTLRRYVKRALERYFLKPWTESEGYVWLEAKPRINWRLFTKPDPNILLPILRDLSKMPATDETIVTALEVRKVLADMGLPIKPDAVKMSAFKETADTTTRIIEPRTPRTKQSEESEKKKRELTPQV